MYALANLHNFQSMFKPGQLLRALVLNSASLLISIKQGLATDPIAQEHFQHLLSSSDPSPPTEDPWSLSMDGDYLLYKGALYVPDHQDVQLYVLVEV